MDKTVSDLLEDAVLVASYGQRSGRFKDAALFAAIQKANAAEPLDWSSPELADLQAALNNAVRAIEPVTLVDLKRGWNPFDKSSERGRAASDIGKAVFVAAAVLLIFLCGYYTLWHKRATLLLDDLSVAKAEQQTAIINEVFFRLVGAGEDALAPDLGSPGSLSRITIREKIDQLRAIERAMIENKRDYNEIVVSTVPGKRFYYEFLGLFNRPPDYASASNYMAANAQQPEPPPDAAPSGAPSGLQAAVLNRCVGAGPPGADKSDAFAEPAAATGVWWFNSLVTEQDQLLG